MKNCISRDNYEVCFMDFLDGKLSSRDTEVLFVFLEENPDLKQELDSIEGFVMQSADKVEFPNKEKLMRAPAPFYDLTFHDYLMVKSIEDGISVNEQDQLDHMVKKQPKTKRDLSLYQKAKLVAPNITYNKKKDLKRRSISTFFIPIIKTGVAAAIIIGTFYLIRYDFSSVHQREFISEHVEPLPHTPDVPQVYSHKAQTTQEEPRAYLSDLINVSAVSDTEESAISDVSMLALSDEPNPLPGPALKPISVRHLPNSYETGLNLMIPMYVENRRLLAGLYEVESPADEVKTKSLFGQAAGLLSQISPLNLNYNKVYDHEGDLVAIHISSDNFEMMQKVPKWFLSHD